MSANQKACSETINLLSTNSNVRLATSLRWPLKSQVLKFISMFWPSASAVFQSFSAFHSLITNIVKRLQRLQTLNPYTLEIQTQLKTFGVTLGIWQTLKITKWNVLFGSYPGAFIPPNLGNLRNGRRKRKESKGEKARAGWKWERESNARTSVSHQLKGESQQLRKSSPDQKNYNLHTHTVLTQTHKQVGLFSPGALH